MDVGASYGGYAADITRTVPVSGRFTREQRAVYDRHLVAIVAAARDVVRSAERRSLRGQLRSERPPPGVAPAAGVTTG